MHISPSMIKLASASCALICSLGMGTVALAATNDIARPEHSQEVTHLYNPYTHEHFYSSDAAEVKNLVSLGWQNHGRAWYAPEKDAAGAARVYRLFNPYNDDHHYTSSMEEVKACVEAGWQFEENVEIWGFASSDAPSGEASQAPRTGVQRLFNPYAERSTHYFTANQEDAAKNVALGWKYESTSWYVYSAGQPEKEKAQDDAGGAVLGMLGGGGAAAGAGAEDAGAGNPGAAGGDNGQQDVPGAADHNAQNGGDAQAHTPNPKTLSQVLDTVSKDITKIPDTGELKDTLDTFKKSKEGLKDKTQGSSEQKAAEASVNLARATLRSVQLDKFIGSESTLSIKSDSSLNDNFKRVARALKDLTSAEHETLVAPDPSEANKKKTDAVGMLKIYKKKIPVNEGYKTISVKDSRAVLNEQGIYDAAVKEKLKDQIDTYKSLLDTIESLVEKLKAAKDQDSLEFRFATNMVSNINKDLKDPIAYYKVLAGKDFSPTDNTASAQLTNIKKQYMGRLTLIAALNEWISDEPNEELCQKAAAMLVKLPHVTLQAYLRFLNID